MKFVTILVLIFLVFTEFVMTKNRQEYYLSRGEQLVNSILGQTARIIKEKHNLKPCGSGAAMPGGPIQELTLCFDTKYPHSKEQLRELLIKSAHELLNQVRENEEIQPFLKERPFTIKNVEIIIYNHDERGFSLKDPHISVANISQGQLNYSSIDPEDSFRYKNEYEESYEEALKAVQNK